MTNERLKVNDILNGVDLNAYHMRYYCTLLVRHYYGLGINDEVEIRKLIFTWANKYGLYIKLSVKHLIREVLEKYVSIENHNGVVNISKSDIEYIKTQSTKKSTRKLALLILCYAKAFANENGDFDVNIRILSEWGGLNVNNVYNRQLKELLEIRYVEDLEEIQKWKDYIQKYTRKLRINYSLNNNNPDYVLKDNNFMKFYGEIDWGKRK